MLRHAGGEPARAGDAPRLRTDRVDVAEHDVVDGVRIDTGALDQRGDPVRAEVGGMNLREAATTATDGRADGIDDERFGHDPERTRRQP